MEVLGDSAPTLTLFEGARKGDSRAVEGSSDRLTTTTIPVSLFTTSAEAVHALIDAFFDPLIEQGVTAMRDAFREAGEGQIAA